MLLTAQYFPQHAVVDDNTPPAARASAIIQPLCGRCGVSSVEAEDAGRWQQTMLLCRPRHRGRLWQPS